MAFITCSRATTRSSVARCSSGTRRGAPSLDASWCRRDIGGRGAVTPCSRFSSAPRSPPVSMTSSCSRRGLCSGSPSAASTRLTSPLCRPAALRVSIRRGAPRPIGRRCARAGRWMRRSSFGPPHDSEEPALGRQNQVEKDPGQRLTYYCRDSSTEMWRGCRMQRFHFTPFAVSTSGQPAAEASALPNRLAYILHIMWDRPLSVISRNIRQQVSFATVRACTHCVFGQRVHRYCGQLFEDGAGLPACRDRLTSGADVQLPSYTGPDFTLVIFVF